MADFQQAFQRTMAFEDNRLSGVVTPEPDNGRARFGINSLAHPDLPDSFWTGPAEDALQLATRIFEREYWDPLRLTQVISDEVADKLFDMAINMGVLRVGKYAQEACNIVAPDVPLVVDGVIGSHTLTELNTLDAGRIHNALKLISRSHYQKLLDADPEKYGHWREGWMVRADR